jgi:hypothetical protein
MTTTNQLEEEKEDGNGKCKPQRSVRYVREGSMERQRAQGKIWKRHWTTSGTRCASILHDAGVRIDPDIAANDGTPLAEEGETVADDEESTAAQLYQRA